MFANTYAKTGKIALYTPTRPHALIHNYLFGIVRAGEKKRAEN